MTPAERLDELERVYTAAPDLFTYEDWLFTLRSGLRQLGYIDSLLRDFDEATR